MEQAQDPDVAGATPLDVSRLQSAIRQLERYLAFVSDASTSNPLAEEVGRAAAIQAFEFTYELSIRLIRRFLELSEAGSEAPKTMSFNNLVRLAYERGLVAEDLRGWLRFREMRNATSHAYDEAIAEDVHADIPRFLTEARQLLAVLTARQGDLA